MKAVERTVGFMFIAVLALLPIGCLADNAEYDKASRDADEYQNQLQSIRLANDQLNRDITALYSECEALNSQLATLAALNIHDRYTEGLKRSEPVAAAAPPPRTRPATPARTTPQTTTTRPRVNTEAPAPRRDTGGQRGTGTQGGGGRQGGGSAPATVPSPPPPSRTDGAIDWGF